MTAALVVRKLTVAYRRVEVVHAIDFEAASGQLLTILGANGAGKSSLLGALSGLVSARGSIRIAEKECVGIVAHKRTRMGIALVPEVRGNLFPTMTVEENLQIALRDMHAADAGVFRDQIYAMFPILLERGAAMCGMLSGGEQQMLAIGIALGRRPQVLLLDEPTQGLAPSVFDVLQSAFALLKSKGLAIVMAEQSVPFAARCADFFFVMAGGRISLRGKGHELHDQDRLMAAYLGQTVDDDRLRKNGFQ